MIAQRNLFGYVFSVMFKMEEYCLMICLSVVYKKQHSELKIDIAWTLFGVLKTTLYLINGIT